MKFYIASRLENAETVSKLAKALTAAGHTHTYDWTEHGSVKGQGQGRLEQVAASGLRGVMDAEAVIVLLPGGRGTHAELGIALGSGCKHIIICAGNSDAFEQDDRTCAFYWNEPITQVVGSMDIWLAEILARGQMIEQEAGQ